MKRIITLITVAATLVSADQFNNLWYDGNAELSTYVLKEKRYGEMRDGVRIMVFVTEPLRLSTKIKPDSKIPDEEKIKVIKLNDLRKFVTGVYDYSAMTSVFAAVEEKPDIPQGSTVKVASTMQEWCGTVFDRMRRDGDAYQGVLYSYFESEGETTYAFKHQNSVESEDNLWLLVRELQGPILEIGESKQMRLIPSQWHIRKTHTDHRIVDATLRKERQTTLETAIGRKKAIVWSWTIDDAVTKVWVEAEYPHKILKFSEPDGSHGSISASVREPYWKLHRNKDLPLRKKLALPTDETL
ncbi:MAG: hypothetical protein GF398_10145 [Chitinivibrionales bacterium]|nr:hypothetical protein [Chitinivibrionales bacterium]